MSDEKHYKVVMLGDSSTGKTALVNCLFGSVFSDAHIPTVGGLFVALPLKIHDRKMIVELWDTAGQEAYRSLVGSYTRGATGAFLVTDATKQQSFETLSEWIRFANDHAEGIQVIIFANKIDLEKERVVAKEDIENFANSNGVPLVEGSAKSGHNVRDAFETMGELLLSAVDVPHTPLSVHVDNCGKNKRKQRCC
jgi:small GTP-binding protein